MASSSYSMNSVHCEVFECRVCKKATIVCVSRSAKNPERPYYRCPRNHGFQGWVVSDIFDLGTGSTGSSLPYHEFCSRGPRVNTADHVEVKEVVVVPGEAYVASQNGCNC